MVRLRWWVIGFWLMVFMASLVLAPRVTSVLKSGMGEADTESRAALRLLSERLDIQDANITLVFSSDDLHTSDPRYIEQVNLAIASLRDVAEVERIITFYNTPNSRLVSPDGRTTYALVFLNTSLDESIDIFPRIRDKIQPTELSVWATGGIAIFSDLNAASKRDLRRAEAITLPIVLIALIIVFGSIVAAGLPMAMGIMSIVITFALMYILAQYTDMSVFALNIASFLGLGMAIDYSLLMVSRYREELTNRGVAEAIAVTCSTAGKAIVFSAVTSVIGLSGLLFFQFMMLRSLGIAGITVIVFSMLLALSLIPAMLAVLGHRVDALTVMPRRFGGVRFWFRLSGWVMRHPVAIVVPVSAGLLLLGSPFLGVKLGIPWASILPKDAESRQGWEVVADEIGPGELAPIIVVSTSETGVLTTDNTGAAYDFAQGLSSDPRVARVDGIVSLDSTFTREQYQAMYSSPSPARLGGPAVGIVLDALTNEARDTSMMSVVSNHDPVSDESKALVRDIRADPPGGDLQTFVTGATPELMDTVDRMYADFPKVVVYVAVATYLALFLLFRSVVLPLKAVVMNAMSILASFGALVFVFQEGHFERLLGFTAEGFTEATVPILLFSLVFGLSMDYEVFLLARIKEEYDATGDNTHSVAVGMEKSGKIITSAALILVLVSIGLATGDILIVKALGFGTALAIFIDSTIVRALLVPALMRILSDLNWWAPGFLKGSQAKTGVPPGGSPSEPMPPGGRST